MLEMVKGVAMHWFVRFHLPTGGASSPTRIRAPADCFDVRVLSGMTSSAGGIVMMRRVCLCLPAPWRLQLPPLLQFVHLLVHLHARVHVHSPAPRQPSQYLSTLQIQDKPLLVHLHPHLHAHLFAPERPHRSLSLPTLQSTLKWS